MLDQIVELKLADFWRALRPDERKMNTPTLIYPGPTRFAHMEKLLREGWREGAEAMKGAVGSLRETAGDRTRPRLERGHHTGFDPDVGALLDGRPDAFSLWSGKKARRLVKFVVEVGNACGMGISVEGIISQGFHMGWGWQGACAIALAEDYDARGYQVEIDAVEMTVARKTHGSFKHVRSITKIQVKSAEETLSPDFAAAILCHSEIYAYGWLPQCERIACSTEGHGEIFTLTQEDLAQIGYDAAEVVHVPLTISSEAQARAWLETHEVGKEFIPDGGNMSEWQGYGRSNL